MKGFNWDFPCLFCNASYYVGEVQELDETVKFSVMHTKLIQAKLVQAK